MAARIGCPAGRHDVHGRDARVLVISDGWRPARGDLDTVGGPTTLEDLRQTVGGRTTASTASPRSRPGHLLHPGERIARAQSRCAQVRIGPMPLDHRLIFHREHADQVVDGDGASTVFDGEAGERDAQGAICSPALGCNTRGESRDHGTGVALALEQSRNDVGLMIGDAGGVGRQLDDVIRGHMPRPPP